MIATEPLTDEQLAPIGWQGEQGIEDARNLIHYYRLTPDKRIVMGGGPVGLTYGGKLEADTDEGAFAHLEEHIAFLWPHLRGVGDHPPLGRAVLGHARSHAAIGYAGRARRRLQPRLHRSRCLDEPPQRAGPARSAARARQRARRGVSVRRTARAIPWPAEPLASAAAHTLRGYLRAEDAFYERKLPAL